MLGVAVGELRGLIGKCLELISAEEEDAKRGEKLGGELQSRDSDRATSG